MSGTAPSSGPSEPTQARADGELADAELPHEPTDELTDELHAALDQESTRVEQRIRSLSRDLDDIVENSADAVRDDEHDPEGSTIAFERAQVSALLDAAYRQRSEIDVARQRLREGAHGRCDVCGERIPAARRLARPTARTCLACAP